MSDRILNIYLSPSHSKRLANDALSVCLMLTLSTSRAFVFLVLTLNMYLLLRRGGWQQHVYIKDILNHTLNTVLRELLL